jgi:ABC-2 type transport system permease protein
MVYSIGQSEQYGFYKRITFWASPYDADMAEEIANPERLQTGTLDFSFTILFILPLVLLVLLYNLKSTESEQGFLPLIQVQLPSVNLWLFGRISFYFFLIYTVIVGLLFYGAVLSPVFEGAGDAIFQMMVYTLLYLLFWSLLFYAILIRSKTILGSTLFMSAVYLLFTFVVPAAVHQVLSIRHPANLMTDLIDVRDKEQELYRQPDSVFQAKLEELFPEITESPVYRDSLKKNLAMNRSAAALSNELNKESIGPIEAEKTQRNTFIEGTFWFNPVSFFQNRFNSISETHYTDYQNYRDEIQTLIDEQIRTLVLDTWKEKRVDKQEYLRYTKELSHDT